MYHSHCCLQHVAVLVARYFCSDSYCDYLHQSRFLGIVQPPQNKSLLCNQENIKSRCTNATLQLYFTDDRQDASYPART